MEIRNIFLTDGSFKDSVKLGSNLSLVKETIQVITNVFYVPDLKNNLLSIGQLQEKGLAILFQHDQCKVYHPEKGLIMETTMASNRMFVVNVVSRPISSACFNTITEDMVQLWYCRYGHLSFKGLKTLQQKEMVHGLPQLNSPLKLCKDSLVGKQQRDPFPKKSNWRASQILQLIYTDICGPIKPVSNSKKRYFPSFIDDFSRKLWVYFLTEKSVAFATFKRFKTHVEKETNSSIRGICTDRGEEFTSQEFSNFCSENGIKRQLTTAYTLQQNGVAERKNRTIINRFVTCS